MSDQALPTSYTTRPRKIRIVCWIMAALIMVVFTIGATLLRGPIAEGRAPFELADQIAMIVLGVLFAAGILLFARPRVTVDARGIQIRNIVASYELPWAVVREVSFPRGSSWLQLNLADDDTVAVMAVQAADKERALAATRMIRAFREAYLTSH